MQSMEYITSPRLYFAYILVSTTCRNLETGMVAAMMTTIKQDLNMSYTMEGVVAASPDFGIVPAGVLAIFVFQYFPAHRVLVAGQFVIGLAALIAVVWPNALSLVKCFRFHRPRYWYSCRKCGAAEKRAGSLPNSNH